MMQLLRNLLGCKGRSDFQPATKHDFATCCMAGDVEAHPRVSKRQLMKPTKKQIGVQKLAADKLRKDGSITQWDIQQLGTTSASKVVYRLRKLGVIDRDEYEPNAKGVGQHKRYYASKKWRSGR